MNRWRGPSKALMALTIAGLVGWSATARAENPNDVYTNFRGLSGVAADPLDQPAVGVAEGRRAGMTLNPGGVGQWLWGTFYDVRPVTNPTNQALDAQDTNIQILNTNPNNPADPEYNPYGGLIFRIRFRESKTSQEVLDFDVIVSCGEVWTAKVSLPSGATVPVVTSNDPIRATTSATTFTTLPLLIGGKEFSVPSGLTAADTQRGYFEVIAEEALPCEPIDGQVDRSGDTWSRVFMADHTPTNALAGEEIIIRVAAGVSYTFNLEAISRFLVEGSGSILQPPGSGLPTLGDCTVPDNTNSYTGIPPGPLASGNTNCRNQMNFALSKSRLTPQYDIDPAVGGSTHIVVTLPTKHDSCGLNGSGSAFNGIPVAPFSCQGTGSGAQGGEQIGCLPYNRIEDFPSSSDIFSPGVTSICKLPREMTIIGIVDTNDSPRADENIRTNSIPREHLSGWVDFDLITDPGNPLQVHAQSGLNPNLVDLLATGFQGYNGLPALSLVLQEYSNGAVSGVYGNSVPPPYEVDLIKPTPTPTPPPPPIQG